MYIHGRKVLKNQEVCLILVDAVKHQAGDRWTPYDMYRICLPQPGLLGRYQPVGWCDLRLDNTRFLYYAGNIGYRVDPRYRGAHMALKASRLLLEEARNRGLPYIILTCNPENTASRRTIEQLCAEYDGKYLEKTAVPSDHDLYSRGERVKLIYRIDLYKDQNKQVFEQEIFQAGSLL